MPQIFTNTPASLRPNVALQVSGGAYKTPDERRDDIMGNNKGKNVWREWFKREEPTDRPTKRATITVDEYRSHVTEEHEEFQTPRFSVLAGKANKNAGGFMSDVLNRIEIMTPWARGIVGPAVVMRNPMGELVDVKAMLAETTEDPEEEKLPTIEALIRSGKARNRLEAFDIRSAGMVASAGTAKITTIAVSTNQTAEEAMRSVFATCWQEIERRAIAAYGMEWADSISHSLDETQALVVAEDYRSEEKRRKDAFVLFAMNAENGAVKASDEESPHCFVVFQQAHLGDLGKRLAAYHNPY